jgi:hypothetical protein
MEFFAALGFLVFFFGLLWIWDKGFLEDFGVNPKIVSIICLAILFFGYYALKKS